MDDDTNDDSVPPVPVHTSAELDVSLSSLTDNINRWVLDGQPILNDLLQSLHESKVELDPIIETFIFSIVGGYTYNFSKAMTDGMSVIESNSHAITSLMTNPKVSSMMESFMQDRVSAHIESVVE